MTQRWQVVAGDCLTVLRTLKADCIDAVVTDPPGFISFMGKSWDGNRGGRTEAVAWLAERLAEVLRVTKPGGHALIWALPRSAHWTMCAIEDSGWDIRDVIFHHFGSGMPKGTNVGKAVDKYLGKEREVVGVTTHPDGNHRNVREREVGVHGGGQRLNGIGLPVTAPNSPEAIQWDDWHTELKPSTELWILCRKPLKEKTIARQVLATGTGALNVGACRIQAPDGVPSFTHRREPLVNSYNGGGHAGSNRTGAIDTKTGRFPSHLLLSHAEGCVQVGTKQVKGSPGSLVRSNQRTVYGTFDKETPLVGYAGEDGTKTVAAWQCVEGCPVALIDTQSGVRTSGKSDGFSGPYKAQVYGAYARNEIRPETIYGDTGTVSRYFTQLPYEQESLIKYCPKASPTDRNFGCEALPKMGAGTEGAFAGDGRGRQTEHTPAANGHPTTKSTALMAWLCRLVTPPGGIVLDCFAGSGSTGVAAVREGFRFLGIELDEEGKGYVEIAQARIRAAEEEVERTTKKQREKEQQA